MNVALRILIVTSCFFAAIACYSFGVPFDGWIFLVLGLLFEGMFWTRIFGKKKKIS
jgi:hypothetical protein